MVTIKKRFQQSDWLSDSLNDVIFTVWAVYSQGQAANIKQNKMAASSPFANVSDEEILEVKISAVPKTTQNATKYGVKLFIGK